MAFLAVVPSLVLSFQGIADPTEVDLEVGFLDLLAGVLAALGPAAMAVYLLWRDRRLSEAGFDRRPAGFVAGYGALGWVCTFIAFYTVATIAFIVIQLSGGDPLEGAEDAAFDLTWRTAVAGLVISLTAGVAEEIVFRAYAISRLEEAGYRRAAVLVPWAVFTLVHLYQGPMALLVIGPVAAVFVWLYLWKRSVWPVMVAHAAYNVTVLLLAAAAS